jgi:hypothetical protein
MRRCIDCQQPHTTGRSRCPTCNTRRYGPSWRTTSRTTITQHLARYGPTCPGYHRPPHPVPPTRLVTDHDLGVLCTSCNAAKANTEDRGLEPPRRRR